MAKRKRKAPIPLALLWTRRDQLRFISTVEKLVSHVNDLGGLLKELKELQDLQAAKPKRKKIGEPGSPVNPSGE